MNKVNKQAEVEANTQTAVDSAPVDGLNGSIARRRLIRAGLSAAPVMLAMKSQSVLAADICIKPSAFSSLKGANMKLSRAPNQGWICYSHGYWKNVDQHPHPSPYTDTSKSYFLTKPLATGEVSAGFTSNPNGAYTGKTLLQVLEMTGNDNSTALARHIVGTFLTAVKNSDDPTKVLLTTWQCKQIWDNGGNWSPVTGQTWTIQTWLDYFNYVYGVI